MAKSKLIRCPDDGYRFLAGKVMQQSERDLRGDDLIAALDALVWWLFADGWLWADALGVYMSPYRVLNWILGGCKDDQRTNDD